MYEMILCVVEMVDALYLVNAVKYYDLQSTT